MKYDYDHGEYPESDYEGLSVYEFICYELGIPSDFENDHYNAKYAKLVKETFKETTNESTSN